MKMEKLKKDGFILKECATAANSEQTQNYSYKLICNFVCSQTVSQKLCSICGDPIPEGRLEVMPRTNVCTNEDYGNCPRCGSKLKLCHGPKVDFIGCNGFPSCTYKEWLSRKLGSTHRRNNQNKQFKIETDQTLKKILEE